MLEGEAAIRSGKKYTSFNIIQGLCMLGLPLVHITEGLAEAGCLVTEGFSPEALLILTAAGPAVFMICMGFKMGRMRSPRHLRKKGLQMLFIGLVLNICRYLPELIYAILDPEVISPWIMLGYMVGSDIYIFVGLFYFLMALFRKLKLSAFGMLMITLLMLTVNTLVMNSGILVIENHILASIAGNFMYVDAYSCFPLLSWSIFPVCGICLKEIFGKGFFEEKTALRFAAGSGIFLFALLTALKSFGLELFPILVSPLNSYITEFFGAVIQIALMLLITGIIQCIILHTRENRIEDFLARLSALLMPYYFLHWIVCVLFYGITVIFTAGTHSVGIGPVLLLALGATVVSIVISKKFGLRLMRRLLIVKMK